MEEIFELIKKELFDITKVTVDEDQLVILIKVNVKSSYKGILAEPFEIKDMLKMLGGLKEDISMKIEIESEAREIRLKFNSKEDLEKVKKILDIIWEQTIHIVEDLVKGNYDIIKDMGDFRE
jgi:hypothetical protein